MRVPKEGFPRIVCRRLRPLFIGSLIAAALASVLAGCSRSPQQQAEEDKKGRELNEQAMMRMIQEQTGQQPGAAQPGMPPGGMQPGQPMQPPGAVQPPAASRLEDK